MNSSSNNAQSVKNSQPRGLALCAALVLGALVAGCADRVTGVLTPYPEPVFGTDVVDMFVVTTRGNDDEEPAMMFSGSRSEYIAYANISVSIPPGDEREIGEIQWPKSLPGDPTRDFITTRAEHIDKQAYTARFNEAVSRTDGRHVLVFVHGYNNPFEDAVYRFAQIVHDSDASVVPVLFTWPSRGQLLGYTYDRESANYSRDGLEQLLSTLVKDKSVSEITVLAHSMGNWLTLESLRQMAIRNGRIPSKIQDVMLAAPDVDVDVFRTQAAAFGEQRPRFTLFVSQNDKALAFSRRVWGNVDRLGAIDPTTEPYLSELRGDGIAVVDLTAEKTGDRMHHATFAESPAAVQLIGQQLASGQAISTYEPGVGDRVGQLATSVGANIGAATGLIVTAPLTILDSNARKTYDQRFQEFGDNINQTMQDSGELVTVSGSGGAVPVSDENTDNASYQQRLK